MKTISSEYLLDLLSAYSLEKEAEIYHTTSTMKVKIRSFSVEENSPLSEVIPNAAIYATATTGASIIYLSLVYLL